VQDKREETRDIDKVEFVERLTENKLYDYQKKILYKELDKESNNRIVAIDHGRNAEMRVIARLHDEAIVEVDPDVPIEEAIEQARKQLEQVGESLSKLFNESFKDILGSPNVMSAEELAQRFQEQMKLYEVAEDIKEVRKENKNNMRNFIDTKYKRRNK
jgi:hypothetical protein